MVTIAAIIFALLIGIIFLFQLGLAAGMPWGEAAMGGKYPGKFPLPMRIASLFQMLVLLVLAIIVLVQASLLFPELKSIASFAIWFVVAFSIVATILNSITPSKLERNLWAPVSLLLLISSIIVALNS